MFYLCKNKQPENNNQDVRILISFTDIQILKKILKGNEEVCLEGVKELEYACMKMACASPLGVPNHTLIKPPQKCAISMYSLAINGNIRTKKDSCLKLLLYHRVVQKSSNNCI